MAAPIRKSAKRWLTCCGICGVVSLVLGGCLWLILAPVIVDIIVQLNFITSTVRSRRARADAGTKWSGRKRTNPRGDGERNEEREREEMDARRRQRRKSEREREREKERGTRNGEKKARRRKVDWTQTELSSWRWIGKQP